MSTVLIVDDHPIVRMAIRFLVEKEGHCVIAETGDGAEALELVNLHYPAITIIDVDIVTLNGLDVVKRLREASYPGIIIVISGKNADFYSPRSAMSGADGFISKKNNLPELVSAIKAAQNGYGYFPLKRFESNHSQQLKDDQERLCTLSPQEFQVFQHIIKGFDNMKIAGKMMISHKTVSTYKSRMMDKLGCKTQLDLFDFARRNKLD
ncbi:TPA: response regulator [Klebsiella quasipneumoniae subsp. similipneumoniae]|nr:response regulator [Klebsiella quasipneumoniae subsp. similipneumoniae]HBT4828842.1 response regulator [Klebsiella quasipneumoniae subsp. similipneumoniae]